MTIVVTGTLAFDYIMSFSGEFTDYLIPDQLEHLSVSFLVDTMRRESGGTAGNIAYNLALLKQPVMLLAPIGQDGRDYLADLAERGVDTSMVLQVEDEFTSSFFVSTDRQNRQIANFFVGASRYANQVGFHQFNDPGRVHIATVSPTTPDAMVQYVRECKDLDIPYMFDPSQQIPLFSKEQLTDGIDGAYMLTVNDYEFEIIKKRTGLSEEDINAMVEVLVVTRGEDGSSIHVDGLRLDIPTVPNVKVVDPTGAGDAYRSGLLAGRQHGLDWLEAGHLATLTATYALEEIGTQRHQYTPSQFADRYMQVFEASAGAEAFFQQIAQA